MSSSSTRLPTQLTNTSSTKKMRVTVSRPLLLEQAGRILVIFLVQFSNHKSTMSSFEPVNRKHRLNFNISADTSNFYTLDGHWSNFVRNSSRAREIEIRSMLLQCFIWNFRYKTRRASETINSKHLHFMFPSWELRQHQQEQRPGWGWRRRDAATWVFRQKIKLLWPRAGSWAQRGSVTTTRGRRHSCHVYLSCHVYHSCHVSSVHNHQKQVRTFLCFQNHRRQIKSTGNSNFSPTHYSKLT